MADLTIALGQSSDLDDDSWCLWSLNAEIPASLVVGTATRRLVSVSIQHGQIELSLVDGQGNAASFSQAVQDSPQALTFIVGSASIQVPGPDAGTASGSFEQYDPPNLVALNAFCEAHHSATNWQLRISDVAGPVDLRAEAATALGASISLPASARAYVDPQRADAATGLAASIALPASATARIVPVLRAEAATALGASISLPASATARIVPVLRAEAATGLAATISLPSAAEGSEITAPTLRAKAATGLAATADLSTSASAHLDPQYALKGDGLAATADLSTSASAHLDPQYALKGDGLGAAVSLPQSAESYIELVALAGTVLEARIELPGSALASYEAVELKFPEIDDQSFILGQTINITLPRATGGIFIYDYSATLPSWLTLVAEGSDHKIRGVAPITAQDLSVTVTVRSGDAAPVSRTFTISVTVEDTSPVFPPFRNPTFVAGVDVHEVLPMANGGNGTLVYSIVGSLPVGLAFNDSTRALTGRPTRAGVYTVKYRVLDADGDTYEQVVTITIAAAMSGSPLMLPPAGDRIFFVGDDIDETLPAPYGGRGPLSYSITPAIGVTDSERLGEAPTDVGAPPVLASLRRVRGEFTRSGKTTHVIRVTDADNLSREEDITIDVRRLDLDTGPPIQGRDYLEARIAFLVPESGARRGFAYVSDELRASYAAGRDGVVTTTSEGKLRVEGQEYEIGEVVGLGRYEIEMSSSRPLPVEVEGNDPQFRQWLEFGGSARDVEVRFLLKGLPAPAGASDAATYPKWETAFTIVGRVGRVVGSGENYILDVDSEIYIPSQQGATRWSDEEQREAFPGDRFWSQLKALARGHVLTWPGLWLFLALSNVLVRQSAGAL